jgi:hypothetical protein
MRATSCSSNSNASTTRRSKATSKNVGNRVAGPCRLSECERDRRERPAEQCLRRWYVGYDEIPEQIAPRLMSVRAFDARHYIVAADVTPGAQLGELAERLF